MIVSKMITVQEKVANLNSKRYKRCSEVATKILARLANESDTLLNRLACTYTYSEKLTFLK